MPSLRLSAVRSCSDRRRSPSGSLALYPFVTGSSPGSLPACRYLAYIALIVADRFRWKARRAPAEVEVAGQRE